MSGEVAFGAIRWDAFYSATGPARYVAQSLSAKQFRSRAPVATDASANRLVFSSTQATMDAEINAASASGLKYWAFLRYPDGNEMNAAFDLYAASSLKSLVKHCWISQLSFMGSSGNYTPWVSLLTSKMQDASWMKTLGNRPLLYIMWSDSDYASLWGSSFANVKAAIDALRASVVAAGLGTPYVVLMAGGTSLSRGAIKTGIGADALSDYVSQTIPPTIKGTFASLDTTTRSWWASLAAAGSTVVPICMSGWDRRPRIDRPVSWEASYQKPGVGHLIYILPPTNAELVAHLQAAKDYVVANPDACPAAIALIYAWNEFDEGGWLAPTIGDPSGSRLTAIAPVIS